MKLLIIGATGALGREIVADALAREHHVTALVRDPATATLPAHVNAVRGDILHPDTLPDAVTGQDAVICALGTPSPRQPNTLLRDGTANLIATMQAAGVARLACVTLLGAGSSRANASRLYRQVILRMLAPMIPDKQAQEHAVRDSELDWVLIRPPRFTSGTPRGNVRVITEGQRGRVGRVIRADLAHGVDHVGVDGGLPARPTRPRTPGPVGRTRRDAHRSARTARSSVGR